jgi:hypothetical protein
MRISFCSALSAKRPGTMAFEQVLPMIASFLILCGTLGASAQQTMLTPPQPSFPEMRGSSQSPAAPDPLMGHMAEQMALARNTQRQKQIVSESAHLLDLAQKLNTDVTKSNKNELSVSVVKEAEQIEKLAKSIKDKMRYGD